MNRRRWTALLWLGLAPSGWDEWLGTGPWDGELRLATCGTDLVDPGELLREDGNSCNADVRPVAEVCNGLSLLWYRARSCNGVPAASSRRRLGGSVSGYTYPEIRLRTRVVGDLVTIYSRVAAFSRLPQVQPVTRRVASK